MQFAHLMTSALMLLPLILAVLDEILIRQKYDPRVMGLCLGLLLFAQFFLSSELLAVMAIVVVVCLLVLVGVGWTGDRERLRRQAGHAVEALVTGGVVGGGLLALPVWFALDGPGHLSGLIWPNIGAVGGYAGKSFVSPNIFTGKNVYAELGGYEGTVLPSSGYLGWALLSVLAGGLVIWFRDRRLWFFGFLLALCVVCSLGERPGQWEPSRVFSHIPVIENVIAQRFMAVGFLAAAAMLAIILDLVRQRLPAWLELHGTVGDRVGIGGALGVCIVGLLPIATTFAPTLPFAMREVTLPRWYTAVAPHLPPGRVLLSYPVPFSGIQVTMGWQAVNAMHYSQAGGGGPEGVSTRAGAARAGFDVLGHLAFSVRNPQPVGTLAQFSAVRHALALWQVNTVVIAPNPSAPPVQQGHDPYYAAAFMTAALDRLPTIEAGAWVWNNVSVSHGSALKIPVGTIAMCVSLVEKDSHPLRTTASMRVANCVGLEALVAAE
jgi:hypothetical protein